MVQLSRAVTNTHNIDALTSSTVGTSVLGISSATTSSDTNSLTSTAVTPIQSQELLDYKCDKWRSSCECKENKNSDNERRFCVSMRCWFVPSSTISQCFPQLRELDYIPGRQLGLRNLQLENLNHLQELQIFKLDAPYHDIDVTDLHLPNLRHLSISNDGTIILGENLCRNMPLLERLDLSSYGVSRPSVRLDQYTSIMWLKISSAGLRSLADVQFPVTMTHLDVSNNDITTLADVQFPGIMTHLDVSNNDITTLADVQFPGIMTHLDVSNNDITTLADVQFPGIMTHLDVSNNDITTLADVQFPVTMTHLDVSNNDITTLADVQFPGIMTHLDVSYNCIDTLGDKFCENMTLLEKLDISHNRLSVIMFSGCTHLMWLSISRNHLKTLVDVQFPANMTYLDISYNIIHSLEDARFPTDMTFLDISYNMIHSLGENFCDRVQGLQEMNVSLNTMSVNSLSILNECTELTWFDATPHKQCQKLMDYKCYNDSYGDQVSGWCKCKEYNNRDNKRRFCGWCKCKEYNNRDNKRRFCVSMECHYVPTLTISQCFPHLRELTYYCSHRCYDALENLSVLKELEILHILRQAKFTFPNVVVTHLPLSNIRHMRLDGVLLSGQSSWPSSVLLCRAMPLLERLEMSRMSTFISNLVFTACKKLTWLELSFSWAFVHGVSSGDLAGATFPVSLEHLNVSTNEIDQLSANFCENMALLETLDISHNRLRVIMSTAFEGCTNVMHLDLSRNHLTHLPDVRFLANLVHLNVSNNGINQLPANFCENMARLERLDVSRNKVKLILPTTFQGCRELTKLDIYSNNLTTVIDIRLPCVDKTYLNDTFNKMATLSENSHENITLLKKLDASGSDSSAYALSIYDGCNHLMWLNLSLDYVTDLGDMYFPVSTKQLDVHENKITSLGENLCQSMTQLENLDVSHNRLGVITNSTFFGCKLLTHLNVSHNHLIIIEDMFNGLESLRYVDLSINPIIYFDLNMLIQLPPSVAMRLSFYGRVWVLYNYKRSETHSDCDWNCIHNHKCDPSTCSSLRSFIYMQPVILEGCNLYIREELLGASAALINVYNCMYEYDCFDGCSCCTSPGECECRDYCPDQCTCTKNLQDYNKVDCRSHSHLDIPIKFPATTRILDLSGRNISVIEETQFASCPQLEELILSNASVRSIKQNAFHGLKKLQKIVLEHNEITSLDLDVAFGGLPLISLSLAQNPWDCSCEAGLRFNSTDKWSLVMIDAESDNVACIKDFNNNVTKVSLSTRFNHCFSEKVDITLTVVLSVSLIIVGLLISSCLYFRKYIKVMLYYRCGIHLKSMKTDVEGKFDAFISFNQHDMEFVRSELIPRLESPELPYRLCIHHRDWIAGGSITNTIAESVENCRRTILLLSDNFMRSQYCNYEFQAAHHRALEVRRPYLIIVLLEDKLPEGMDQDMLLYTKTHTYLKRSDPLFWEKLTIAMPKLSREEITLRNNHPTLVERILSKQRKEMARRGLRFKNGTVVEEKEDAAAQSRAGINDGERNPTRSQESATMRNSKRNPTRRQGSSTMRDNRRNPTRSQESATMRGDEMDPTRSQESATMRGDEMDPTRSQESATVRDNERSPTRNQESATVRDNERSPTRNQESAIVSRDEMDPTHSLEHHGAAAECGRNQPHPFCHVTVAEVHPCPIELKHLQDNLETEGECAESVV